MSSDESVACSAVQTAYDIGAKLIVCITKTGNTARLVAKYRPKPPILVVCQPGNVASQSRGVLRGFA